MGAIDASILTTWYDSKIGILDTGAGSVDTSNAGIAAMLLGAAPMASSGSTSSDTSTPTGPTPPTPPWASASTTQASSLALSLANGGQLINPTSAQLDAPGGSATATENYKNLFALYQGLTGLQSIAQQASTANLPTSQLQQLQKAFSNGLQQVGSFLDTSPFSGFQVYENAPLTSDSSKAATPQETDTYTTPTIFQGALNSEVPAFEGNVQFSANVTKSSGAQVTVNFDLSQMGAQPRTFANVLDYMNGQMKAAGLATTFSESFTPGAPQTTTVGSTTVNLGDSLNKFALKINGVSVEQLAFSAPTPDPAVYVTQGSGVAASVQGAATTTSQGNAVQQLIKFDASSTPNDPAAINGQVFNKGLGPDISKAVATATAPDGSVYVLANVSAILDGQTIKGTQDVALIKYDSSGNMVFTSTLGAANSATGYSLAVSPDGSQVAVTGSTTDNLNPTTTSSTASSASSQTPQGFITVYDNQGQEQWTQQTAAVGGSGGGVQPNAVAFGSGGMVYVAGQVDGALPGAGSSGGVDGYVQAFHATSIPLNDGSGQSEWVVTPSSTQQFGTTGQDKATGIAVSGSSVYVSSLENGDAVVRSFTASGSSLTPAATRDLGAVQVGGVAGIAVNSDGSIVVAGSTTNGALNAGTVTQAYSGGEEAFIASLAPDLQPSASDRLTYVGSPTDQTASAVAVSGGQVYLTGQIATTPLAGSGQTTAFDGYAAAVDPQTGQVTWTQRYPGQEYEAAPTSIAVSQTGASVLDQLGLPSQVGYGVSQELVANSSVRPGDKFYIQTGGGPPQAVTIASGDTYATLVGKIERASNFSLTATVLPGAGGNTIKLAPAFSDQTAQILAGPPGADALGSLGLKEGVITSAASTESSLAPTTQSGSLPATSSLKNGYSLDLLSSLNLNNPANVKTASTALALAAAQVQAIYQDMTSPPATASAANSGTVPAYLTNEIANYQAALDRLTGGG